MRAKPRLGRLFYQATLIITLFFTCNLPIAIGQSDYLNPGSGDNLKSTFPIHVDMINPSAQANPKGAHYAGFRGLQQVMVYTSAYGTHTGTDPFGYEAIIEDDRVTGVQNADSPIPADGFVVSAQGQTSQWLQRVLPVGALLDLDEETGTAMVTLTPQVYLIRVDKAINRVKSRLKDDNTSPMLSQAELCQSQLQDAAALGLNQQFISLAGQCEALADTAFEESVLAIPGEFHGIWVRPTERSAESVQKAIAALHEAHLNDIFLDTYSVGRTLYPSAVMESYGLPKQQDQFDGWDPLKAWIDAAHQQGMRVHAWVQTFYAGNDKTSIETYGPILSKYPAWRNIQHRALAISHPSPSNIEPGHYFLDPANPDVQTFLQKLMTEIMTNYAVDGLNLDYIRYPSSQNPGTASFLGSTWGYTEAAQKAFQAAMKIERDTQRAKENAEKLEAAKLAHQKLVIKPPTAIQEKLWLAQTDPMKLTPRSPYWGKWVTWRKAQVSDFVKAVATQAHAHNPAILMTAVVFPKQDPGRELKLQDWPTWVKSGWIDALTPIGLGPSDAEIISHSETFIKLLPDKVPLYVGIFGMYNHNPPVDLLSQIEAARHGGARGFVLFERTELDKTYEDALLLGPLKE